MKISPKRVLIVLIILGIFFYLLRGVSGTIRIPINQPLENFPAMLGDWQVQSNRVSSDAVIKMLGVDDYIERDFSSPSGQRVNFYVAFYEFVGNGRGYHSPKNCIPGGGWGIEEVKEIEIHPSGDWGPVTVSEMIIRNGNEYQVVFYWYQNRGRIIHSEFWEKIYLVLDAILKKRRDGAFVRLIAPVPNGDVQQAEKSLQRFAGLAITELINFLPGS